MEALAILGGFWGFIILLAIFEKVTGINPTRGLRW